MPPRIFRPFAVPTNAMLYLAQCGHLWPVVALGHLFCNHFSKWFKKSGSRKVVDQKTRWIYTINHLFFCLRKVVDVTN